MLKLFLLFWQNQIGGSQFDRVMFWGDCFGGCCSCYLLNFFLGEERTYFGGSLEGYFMVVKFCFFFLRLHYLAFRFRKIPQLYHETHLLSFEPPPKKIPSTDGPKKNSFGPQLGRLLNG